MGAILSAVAGKLAQIARLVGAVDVNGTDKAGSMPALAAHLRHGACMMRFLGQGSGPPAQLHDMQQRVTMQNMKERRKISHGI